MFLCQSITSRIPVNDQKRIFKILVLNPTLLNSKNPSHTQISDRKSKNILKYTIYGKGQRAVSLASIFLTVPLIFSRL